MEKETRWVQLNQHKNDVIERWRETERGWNKQPAQDGEHPLGLPDNSEEHPSFVCASSLQFFQKPYAKKRHSIPRERTHFALLCVQWSPVNEAFTIPAAFSASLAMNFWCQLIRRPLWELFHRGLQLKFPSSLCVTTQQHAVLAGIWQSFMSPNSFQYFLPLAHH